MEVTRIKIDDYDYPLPDERIARYPLAVRDECKLLMRDHDGALSVHRFVDISGLLPAGSTLVYNNTRVINARICMSKTTGAEIEIFCLEPCEPHDYALAFAAEGKASWHCFVGNSKRWKSGDLIRSVNISGVDVELRARRLEKGDSGSVVEFSWSPAHYTFSEVIAAVGEIPIPPYLNRKSEISDSEDYQTVFGRIEGSVAAPTAGLHFTDRVLEAIDARGIRRKEITLHVGAGTFQPVKSDEIGDHQMHSEFISVGRDVIESLISAHVIAVGTTSVRTLESLYHLGCMVSQGLEPDMVPQWYPYSDNHPDLSVSEALSCLVCWLDGHSLDKLYASTRIIIAPGYKFKVVKGMVTNFHQPRSTLLLLVSAFTGGDWRRMYDYALEHDFRFLSYGDAQLLL
ncbi:MAG: S-adenosylmethionine:tRNA ribosyltransferase-isomerase [Paramuribaculum sp.]|nr:S-adenosylmethionine:tRNA ribosyltransferase-isomerase [Paramuribaculum sp.]